MKLGVVFPQTEIGNDPIAIRDYAQAVDEAGFEQLIAYDHVLGAPVARFAGVDIGRPRPPYTEQSAFHEVFVLFGYLAAATRRIELATGVLILPQRQTALVAKQAAAVDVLSGGRFRLGIGSGWNFVEYEALGEDFHTRGRRLAEQVGLMRRLWTEPLVDFEGRWDQVKQAGINPLPVQRPIPIWMGGAADVVLRRIAETADGWFAPGAATPELLRPKLEQLRNLIDEAGRDQAAIGIDGRMSLEAGDPKAWVATAGQWRALGATHLSINTMSAGLTTPQQHIDAVLRWKQVVANS
jgi:probable F420-dependent oxidoreductase